MPNLVIKEGGSCWNFKGGTFCNVGIEGEGKKAKEMPATMILNGKVKKIDKINHCWKDEDGKVVCSVSAKGKDGGKEVKAMAVLGRHIGPSMRGGGLNPGEECDPEKDNFCKVFKDFGS
jgi:hypothetical protein